MFYTDKAVLEGKAGIRELTHVGAYFIIANRTLYDHGRATKFAVVDMDRVGVDDVYKSYDEALAAVRAS